MALLSFSRYSVRTLRRAGDGPRARCPATQFNARTRPVTAPVRTLGRAAILCALASPLGCSAPDENETDVSVDEEVPSTEWVGTDTDDTMSGSGSTPGSSGVGTSVGGTDAGAGGAETTAAGGDGSTDSGGSGGEVIDPDTLGFVDFVPIYEQGSAWQTNATARNMVDEVFADFETNLRTSGDWNTTIEVYLTDNNSNNASTGSDSAIAVVDGMTLSVVPAWKKIVQDGPDENGPAQTDGSGADFVIHFNVSPTHESNNGLLRHEMMHGLGCVNRIRDITMSPANVLGGTTPGESVQAALYDLALVDMNGAPILGTYDASSQRFTVNNFVVEGTYNDWIDGDAGVFLRGIGHDGGAYDMFIETFPDGNNASLHLAEPFPLMKSGGAEGHPTWHTIEEPDRAFFRALRYQVAE